MSKEPYTIKFSHYYLKMRGFDLEKPFTLVDAHASELGALTPSFIEYDTSYYIETSQILNSVKTSSNIIKNYKLPKGDLIILYLVQDYRLLTTVRRYTGEKFHFYSTLVGKEVMIKIVEQDKK